MDEKVIPIGMSAGGDNALYVECKHVGHSKAYAACLHIQARLEEGSLNTELYADCVFAIRKGGCPAQKMRQEEVEKKTALYYKPRPKVSIEKSTLDKSSGSYARGWNQVGGKLDDLPSNKDGLRPVKKKPAPKPEPKPKRVETTDFSEVINKMAKKEQQEKSKPKPFKGGSLLDIARAAKR